MRTKFPGGTLEIPKYTKAKQAPGQANISEDGDAPGNPTEVPRPAGPASEEKSGRCDRDD